MAAASSSCAHAATLSCTSASRSHAPDVHRQLPAAAVHMPATFLFTNVSLGRAPAVQQQPPEAAAHMPATLSCTNVSLGRAPALHQQPPTAAAHMQSQRHSASRTLWRSRPRSPPRPACGPSGAQCSPCTCSPPRPTRRSQGQSPSRTPWQSRPRSPPRPACGPSGADCRPRTRSPHRNRVIFISDSYCGRQYLSKEPSYISLRLFLQKLLFSPIRDRTQAINQILLSATCNRRNRPYLI